ncbi:MAG: hypothetical protein Alis3KO_41480 [Aliiglaciecola sp.]
MVVISLCTSALDRATSGGESCTREFEKGNSLDHTQESFCKERFSSRMGLPRDILGNGGIGDMRGAQGLL